MGRSIESSADWPIGIVEQHLHLREVGLPAPFAELVADEDGGLVIGRRAGDVRLGGQDAEPAPRVLGRGDGQGVRLGLELLSDEERGVNPSGDGAGELVGRRLTRAGRTREAADPSAKIEKIARERPEACQIASSTDLSGKQMLDRPSSGPNSG